MFLRLQQYDCNIVYRPGKDVLLSDSLLRFPKHGNKKHTDLNVKVFTVQFNSRELLELQGATASNNKLVLLRKYIISGFSEK